MTATGNQGTLDRAAGALSRGLARKFTRRSVLSKVGKYGVALSLGAAGVALLDDEAWACTNCCASNGGCCRDCCSRGCCGAESRWCGLHGRCPSGTCGCGAWWTGRYCVNSSGQRTGRLMYGDCCGDCGCGSKCTCSSSFNCHGTSSPCPSCCHQVQWYTDPSRSCGQCQCRCPWYIKCRRAFCA